MFETSAPIADNRTTTKWGAARTLAASLLGFGVLFTTPAAIMPAPSGAEARFRRPGGCAPAPPATTGVTLDFALPKNQ